MPAHQGIAQPAGAPPCHLAACLVGLEAGSGSHHIARQIQALGHDARLIPVQYVKPFLKGHKNDYRDAEAIAEAVQRPTMNFVAIKTPEQSDLLSLHRVRSRLIRQRTACHQPDPRPSYRTLAGGGMMNDICRVDVCVRNIEQFEAIHKVRRENIKAPLPALTMVEVTKMVSPDYLIEISAIAVIPQP